MDKEAEKVKIYGLAFEQMLGVWREGATVIFLVGPHRIEHRCETESAAEEYGAFIASEWMKILEKKGAARERRDSFLDSAAIYIKRALEKIDEGEEWKQDDDGE